MDITAVGELLIDLTQVGTDARGNGLFSACPGGAPANVAVMAARLGDAAAFDSAAGEFGNGLFQGKALGSRVGCAVLLTLLKEELPLDCTFVFTAQEEVGNRGAFGAGFSVTPEVALALDGADADDIPGVPAHRRGPALGKGALLPAMDKGSMADRGLFERLRALAEEKSIPWQTCGGIPGRTDAAALQCTKAGVRTATLAVPVRYHHTPSGLISLGDADGVLALTRALLDELAKKE